MRARLAAIACLSAAVGCGGPVELPLEVRSGDLVVIVHTMDGRAAVDVLVAQPGEPVAVEADPDRPIYTWVIARDAQVDAAGAPLGEAAIAATRARFVEDPASPGAGECGACAAPTLSPPYVVHAGDVCPLPAFEAGAVWRPTDGEYRCASARGGRLCAEGGAADHEEIEDLRRRLRLDRPGGCPCRTPPAPASLEGLRIAPIAPSANRLPLEAFAENHAGQIAAFGRSGTVLFDGDQVFESPMNVYEGAVHNAAALRSGDFLVTGDLFNTGARDEAGYFRFSVTPSGLSAPEALSPSAPVHANRMRYFGDEADDFPLYLIGGVRDALGISPTIFACSDDRLACRQVALTDCPSRVDFSRLNDARVDAAGFGLAVGSNALYYKRPSEGPDGITAADPWRCAQLDAPIAHPAPGEAPLSVGRLVSIANVRSRHFVCAQEAVGGCEPTRAVVLTATAGAADPNWRAAYVGPSGSYCRDFLPAQDGLRAVISGAQLVEFDADGNVTGTPSLYERYGSIDGYYGVEPLRGDRVLGRASENRLFVATSSDAFAPLYGAAQRTWRAYESAVARPGGGFYAFGGTQGPVSVSASGEVSEGQDPGGVLAGAYVFSAIPFGQADASSDSGSLPVLLGGEKDGGPWLARAVIRGGDLTDVRPVEVPRDAASVRYLAALGDGALVGTLDTFLYALVGDRLETIPLDWDEPISAAAEVRPAAPVDGCTGVPQRLDTWRAVFAGDGVGWAVGTGGVAFQVTPAGDGRLRAQRFAVPNTSYLSAGRASCPADTWVGGRGDRIDPSGVEVTSVQLFNLLDQEEPRRGEALSPELDPRRQALSPAKEEAIITVNVLDILFGIPVAVLPDTDGRGGPPEPTLVLNNGFLFRSAAGRQLEYLRVPFSPWFATQDERGVVLFGGGDGRLALGRPR